jgi:hypothetical protein
MWSWQLLPLLAGFAVLALQYALRQSLREGPGLRRPDGKVRPVPVARRVDGARVEGFAAGAEGEQVRFAAAPGDAGELVDPTSLERRDVDPDAHPAASDHTVDAWCVAALVAVLGVSWVGVDDFLRQPYAPRVGDAVEVRVDGRWYDGVVWAPAVPGRWSVGADVWSHGAEAVVVSTAALQPRYGSLWGDPPAWRLPHHATALLVALAALLAAALRWQRRDPARVWYARLGTPSPTSSPMPRPMLPPRAGVRLQVATLALAFDATARAAIQAQMASVARSATLDSSKGLTHALASTLTALDRHAGGLRAVSGSYASVPSPDAARRDFEARVDAERGRYTVESLRVDAQGERAVEVAVAPRVEEGGGFVVVTLVVAWDGPVEALLPLASRDDLHRVAVGALTSGWPVKALEVVWVPAAEGDVMSSAEMVRVFPELVWVDDDAAARFGRAVCASCKAAYARELGSCPACGAPAGG